MRIPKSSVPASAWLLVFAALPVELPAEVIHVAPLPGPGVDFTSIQGALDAAGNGDIVVVAAGNYSSATISGKSVTLVAKPGAAAVSIQGMRIENLPLGGTVRVAGLKLFQKSFDPGPFDVPFRADSCAGIVLVQDCAMAYGSISGGDWPGARVTSCNVVSFTRCSMRGILGNFGDDDSFPAGNGGHALVAADSRVFLHDCELFGESGGPGDGVEGGDGGDALVSLHSNVEAYDCRFHGGKGNSGFTGDLIFGFFDAPGIGGAAVRASNSSSIRHQDCFFRAGKNATPPVLADPVQTDAASIEVALSGVPALLFGASAVFAGANVTLTIDAAPIAMTWAYVAPGCGLTFAQGVIGASLLTPPIVGAPLGTTNGSGRLQWNADVPSLPAGVRGVAFVVQCLVIPGSGSPAWTNANAIAVLETNG